MEYAPGRSIDLFGAPCDPTVLLWHGTQKDARRTVRTLANLLADRGLGVAVPDWDSHSDDGGRSDLLLSVDYARSWSEKPDGLVLVGWSLGGVAAAGLTMDAADHGLVLAHTVCLAGAFMVPDPISGTNVTDRLGGSRARYNASADRYEPADDPDTEGVADVVADHVATAAGVTQAG
ncbi:alpha/beta hydrolase family protein [Mycolicibacterium iranicum]|uniref:AB hydrolase-1 domain-containing protein n=1 Tax=Mycolicibacterium iranicum TaxID=912594 RepID=A0A1X1WQE4_MYCIR|nr:alpha/beta fold hydrolase [Mycolicibacterium iranicum]ORV88794.1 hypothetical protein AWC12_13040 [Mycolicibacterium iranicum]